MPTTLIPTAAQWTQALSGLRFARLVVRLRAVDAGHLREFPGSFLYGMLKSTTYLASCGPGFDTCDGCLLQTVCPYPDLWGANTAGASTEDQARPLVLSLPTDPGRFATGDRMEFGITVFGTALQRVPYLVAGAAFMAGEGLGRDRVRFETESVNVLDAQGASSLLWSADEPGCLAREVPAQRLAELPLDSGGADVTIRIPDGAILRDRGVLVGDAPAPKLLARYIRDRYNRLVQHFGGEAIGPDFDVFAAADGVEIIRSATEAVTHVRWSAKQERVIKIHAIRGTVTYGGAGLADLLPLLRMGEIVHVGKYATLGLGRYLIQ
ncbi:MAG: CRISPR system precrRNA processing endoribonuclease RAMP protein Cas6 [Candidatus Sericytochromatia bacterium]|nr:CRISPR system precrRNA processing endoribonuclease RAMP protein Cas6 [Candidatus Tanganyikabacteria bacterium]